MLVRFQLLSPFLEIMFPSDLEDYDWHSLERCIKILRPLKESALLLQKGNADVQTAKSVIKYLRHIKSAELVLNSPVHDTLSKWVDNNPVVNAVFSPDNLQNQFTKQFMNLLQASTRRFLPLQMTIRTFQAMFYL